MVVWKCDNFRVPFIKSRKEYNKRELLILLMEYGTDWNQAVQFSFKEA